MRVGRRRWLRGFLVGDPLIRLTSSCGEEECRRFTHYHPAIQIVGDGWLIKFTWKEKEKKVQISFASENSH